LNKGSLKEGIPSLKEGIPVQSPHARVVRGRVQTTTEAQTCRWHFLIFFHDRYNAFQNTDEVQMHLPRESGGSGTDQGVHGDNFLFREEEEDGQWTVGRLAGVSSILERGRCCPREEMREKRVSECH
jgi:hypothetical protein